MTRPALFVLVGVGFFLHWVIADPTFEESEHQSEWPYVLGFSGAILGLAVVVPLFGRIAVGRGVWALSLLTAAGAVLSGGANVLEDGLQLGFAFWLFVIGSGIIVVGLGALTVAIARTSEGRWRLLALVPLGTLAAIVLYVPVGGPLMLATWLAAALATVARPGKAASTAARTSSP